MNTMDTTTASSITKAASKQTYYTIRFLADRERVDDAYRAYGYFRWVDDILDASSGSEAGRKAFLERQKSLLQKCYQGQTVDDANPQEQMLLALVEHDTETNSGLQLYLRNMMQVMEFDTRRRGTLISEHELSDYTRWLAIAVMEAIHHFIGHYNFAPQDETRYLAVSAAHIIHMLRDTFDDMQLGYYNVPMLNNTTKPIVFVTPDFEGCVAAVEMCEMVAGGAEAFRQRPFATCYINVTSGLTANADQPFRSACTWRRKACPSSTSL